MLVHARFRRAAQIAPKPRKVLVFHPVIGIVMLNNIQVLRAFAAIIVMFVHLDVVLAQIGHKPFGYGGVDLFFVISGFIMVHISRNVVPHPLDFVAKRIIRIVPIYWAFTLFVFSLSFIAPKLFNSTAADITSLVKSLFFVPFEKTPGKIVPIVFVGGSLNYEMFFYVIFALSLFVGQIRKAAVLTILPMLGLVAFGIFASPESVFGRFYTNPMLIEFAGGMLIGLFVEYIPKRLSPITSVGVALVALLSALVVMFGASFFPTTPGVVTVGSASIVLVIAVTMFERGGIIVKSKVIRLIGDASYVIYLSHILLPKSPKRLFYQRLAI